MLLAAVLAASLITPGDVAVARCNNTAATQLEDQLRAFERRAPKADARNDRYAELQLIVSNADQETTILHAVCNDRDFAPINAQLRAVQAWALLQEADLNHANFVTRCPAADKPVESAIIGNAWLLIVRVEEGAVSYPSVATVKKDVIGHAADAGLTLPPPEQASSYWLSQLQTAATTALSACPQ